MDRLDAMKVFVTALDEGSLAAAGRRLRHSPAAVTRAIAALETHIGTRLLHRTTRSIKLTDAGERYAETCRRVLAELDEAGLRAASERSAPRGLLTLTAPLAAGAQILRPVLDDFLEAQPAVHARLLLFDRPVNLIDEGIDLALRIAHLPDSSLIAVRVGEVRRVLCASPQYLKSHGKISVPADLPKQRVIALSDTVQSDTWSFPVSPGAKRSHKVKIQPRLIVNTTEGAIGSAIDGYGISRALSYQIHEHVRAGRLELLLEHYEPPPLPVHLIVPEGRLQVAKIRAFVDFALPRLKAAFAERTRLGRAKSAKAK